jgi:hypothetical protein
MAYSIEQLKGTIGSHGGLAKNNLFSVQLPSLSTIKTDSIESFLESAVSSAISGSSPAQPSELNLLCKNVTLPSRQLNTLESNINGYNSKVVNGSITDDISMTFYVTNSMAVKEYFETWMKLCYNQDTRRVGYFKDYAKPIVIKTLTLPKFNSELNIPGFDKLPAAIKSNMPDISLGPINANLATGSLSLDFGQYTSSIITLENAYPFTMNPIEMGNDTEGVMEITISFTYSEWRSEPGLANSIAGFNPF